MISDRHRRDIEHRPTRDGYDGWAEIYDDEDNALILLEEPRVIDLLGDVAGLDVADLGCGTGRHTLRMAAAGANVTALDFSDGMVARATRKSGWDRVRFIPHDLTHPLPLPDAAFDRVLCALVVDHIHDLPALFAEFRRICRPHGRIIVSTVHPAMMLRGVQAHYTDPRTGREVRPASVPNQISDYVMAALRAGLTFDQLSEHAVDESLAARSPRAAKYLNWPMLLLMRLRP
ncbi:MAG: class I SAM-dependent methyltransferase [Phycisphaerae bacterium]|nr:class I SAM-dependent methyltransferase [Phycisphaerae bacterium]NUQ47363.1 class I SAM-dependent methyltransferase [Phycisphaerae bacterium]